MRRYGAALALWLVVLSSGYLITSRHDGLFASSPDQREEGDILLDLLGEFRTVMARYLWFKMDLFHEVLDEQGVAHEKQSELMPLLRMVTLLDPSITDAYDIIAWDLYKGHGRIDEALEILAEGVRRNPNSRLLLFRQALLRYEAEQYELAEQTAIAAAALSTDEFDILNANRLIYWSAKKLDHRQNMSLALDRLLALRPGDALWLREKAEMKN